MRKTVRTVGNFPSVMDPIGAETAVSEKITNLKVLAANAKNASRHITGKSHPACAR